MSITGPTQADTLPSGKITGELAEEQANTGTSSVFSYFEESILSLALPTGNVIVVKILSFDVKLNRLSIIFLYSRFS